MAAPPRFKVPESVLVVVHTAGGEVLLLERADQPGFWQSVTGSKDAPGEPLEQTCRREVAEETGIEIVLAPTLPSVAAPRGGAAGLGTARRPAVASLAVSNAVHADCLRDWQMRNLYDIYPVWRHRYAAGVTRNTEHVFGLIVPRDMPVTLAPREHLRFEWLGWRDAADRCFSPSNAEAILHLPRFLNPPAARS